MLYIAGADTVIDDKLMLRRLGAIVRGTIDVVLVTRCIVSGHH